jgi:ubiquinol-cytochrome c reductase iron-sulfur subunit
MSNEGNAGRPPRRVGRRPTDATNPAYEVKASEQHILEQHAGSPEEERFAEWQVAALFIVGTLALLGMCVAYFLIPLHWQIGQLSNYALGGCFAVGLFAIGGGFIVWAKKLLPHAKAQQDRHSFSSPPDEERAAEDTFLKGIDDLGLGKRKILRRTLVGALGVFPLPLIVLARDLGPLPHQRLLKTGWHAGSRLVDLDTKLPVKLGDLEIGGIQTVMPEGFTDVDEYALAPTMLIRFGPNEILSDKEKAWGYDNHVAYSKICTHAGCPISLYEQQTHHLLCPCHQSTFDMSRDAKVIFGPAARPLPQLKISVDKDGYFYAVGPYSQAVGPSFWERR